MEVISVSNLQTFPGGVYIAILRLPYSCLVTHVDTGNVSISNIASSLANTLLETRICKQCFTIKQVHCFRNVLLLYILLSS